MVSPSVGVKGLLLATSLAGGMSVASWVIRANELGFQPSWIAAYFLAVGVGNWCYLRAAPRLIARFGPAGVAGAGLILCAAGALLLGRLDSFWISLPVGLVLQAAYPVATACLLGTRPSGESRGLMAGRGLYSVGAILGYPAGTLACSLLGSGWSLLAVGAAQVALALACVATLRRVAGASAGSTGPRARSTAGLPVPLILLVISVALLGMGGPMRNSQFPLVMLNLYHLPTFGVGLVMAIAPAVEAVVFMIAAVLERRGSALRRSLTRVVIIGALFGPASYALSAFAGRSITAAVISQVLFGIFVVINTAVIMSLAVEWRLASSEVTVANLLAGEAVGTMAGSLIAVVATAWIGLPHAFWAPALIAVGGWFMLISAVRGPSRS